MALYFETIVEWGNKIMCGRMTLTADEEIVRMRFNVINVGSFPKHYNGYPNHDTYPWPVIHRGGAETRLVALLGHHAGMAEARQTGIDKHQV
jgi:hypothetical protein